MLNGPFLFLADPTHVKFFGFDLAALFHLLLIGQDQEFLRHADLVDALNIHARAMRSHPTLVADHLLLLLGAVMVLAVAMLTMLPVAVVV